MINDKFNAFKERNANWINAVIAIAIMSVAGVLFVVLRGGVG